MKDLSRRDLFVRTAAASLTVPPGNSAAGTSGAPIHVGAGAGPAPLGAPVETSVPFSAGAIRGLDELAVLSPGGSPVIAQFRASALRPDGSIRWLVTAFEAQEGPGVYTLAKGRSPDAPDILSEDRGEIRIDTGAVTLLVPSAGQWFSDPFGWDLLLTRHDGKEFRASFAGDTCRVVIEERGPVSAALRIEGKCRASDGEALFDFIVRLKAFRARREVVVSAGWVNATHREAELVRDIRFTLPFRFAPERLVLGCDDGVYDAPWVKNWPVFLLQEDHDRYWAKTLNPDGRVQHLASGGANGRHSSGWASIIGRGQSLSVFVPNFWQEYPNEISVRDGEATVGLWPERAAASLAAKPVLPRNPFGGKPYSNAKYWPVMPHPYVAFFDPEKKCLEAPQGLAKTQEIVVGLGGAEGLFERKFWAGSLVPVRGHVDPEWVAASGVATIEPRNPDRLCAVEQLYDESFGWLHRHASVMQAYGKFDYGDFRYFTAGADYLCIPGTKWGEMGEMAREGYWHNNERDTLRGLLLYYLRTGSPEAWELVRSAARHLFDVDIRHHPHWGMYTHSYGHCYLALGEGGEPDHSWLAGMLEWAEMTGDAVALDAIERCGDHLRAWRPDFARTDARSVSVFLHMMCRFYTHSGASKYLEAARPVAETLLRLQEAAGGWQAYLADMTKPRMEGFVEHAMLALADYYVITGDARVRVSLDRAIAHLFPRDKDWKADPGESPLALHALGILAQRTGRVEYAKLARELLEKLREHVNLSPDPRARGDLWAGWGVNEAAGVKVPGRPPQMLGQTRPLSPSSILAYGQECLASIIRLQPPAANPGRQ